MDSTLCHIISAGQFNRDRLERLFRLAGTMETLYDQGKLNRRSIFGTKPPRAALLFFEPSTRTEMSFTVAFRQLGIDIIYHTSTANISSSAAKGESLENTIRNTCRISRPRIIVLRHHDDDAAERAARIAETYGALVFNAGSGSREHPSQMALDLYTIWLKRNGVLDGVKVVLGGDPLASRTIHSLIIGLANNYKIPEIGVCGPTSSSLPDEVIAQIPATCRIINFATYAQAIEWQPNFLYLTRPQLERYIPKGMSKQQKSKLMRELIIRFSFLRINQELADRMQQIGCFYMHPQPVDSENFDEVPDDLMNHPQSLILDQCAVGVPIRMALTMDCLGIKEL